MYFIFYTKKKKFKRKMYICFSLQQLRNVFAFIASQFTPSAGLRGRMKRVSWTGSEPRAQHTLILYHSCCTVFCSIKSCSL